MKKVTRILAILLVLAMLVSGLSACGPKGGKGGNSATDLLISYWNSGLEIEWLNKMIEAFEKEYPEYNVTVNSTASSAAASASFGMVDVDTVDLYMVTKEWDTSEMVALNDVLNATAPGDSKPLIEKFNPMYLKDEIDRDGNYYGLTYGGGILSLAYNKQQFADAGITELPLTTKQLTVVCDQLSRKGYTPLAHFDGNGYWNFISELWFAQADGMDYYVDTFYGMVKEDGTVEPTLDVFTKKDGRYDTLKVYEQIITPTNIMPGSNTASHVEVQTMFLQGKAAMMVNGSWLANEMATTGSMDNFDIMRMPVISTIVDRLETVKGETDLRNLIKAIDTVTDGEAKEEDYKQADGTYKVGNKTVSAADWAIVDEARNALANNYPDEVMFIPSYSTCIDGAKKFMQFMLSDKGYKIYTETLHMALPMDFSDGTPIDTANWNTFEKSQFHLMYTAKSYVSEYVSSKHRIFTDGGAISFHFPQAAYIPLFCANNPADRKNADQIWEAMVQSAKDSFEHSWMANIA